MADATATLETQETRGAVSEKRLWFGAIAAPTAWVVHGLSSYFITWQACQDGLGDWGPLSAYEVRWLLGGVGLTALAAAIAAGVVSVLNWRRLREPTPVFESEGAARDAFMAMGGVLVSIVFAVGITWGSLGPVLVGVCESAK